MNRAKKSNNDLANSDNGLQIANEEPAKPSERLVKLNKELVAARKEFELFNEQIKHQNMRQREFIQNASNELRTINQSILGLVEILLSEPQSMSEYLEPIMMNITRLQETISGILYISKIDNNL